jgi:hypothetical protein
MAGVIGKTLCDSMSTGNDTTRTSIALHGDAAKWGGIGEQPGTAGRKSLTGSERRSAFANKKHSPAKLAGQLRCAALALLVQGCMRETSEIYYDLTLIYIMT